MELARVELTASGLHGRGTQLGSVYELRYELSEAGLRVSIAGGPSREFELGEHDFFDLGFSPLFNTLPIRRDGLHRGGEARDYVMAWVNVPSLELHRSEQRYEPLEPGRVRFSSGIFGADLDVDDDGLVVRYPGIAERIA